MTKLTEEQIKTKSHISTETIEKYIIYTKNDILRYKREIKGYRLIGDRWSVMRADAREGYIVECEDLIESLECILEYRNKQKEI